MSKNTIEKKEMIVDSVSARIQEMQTNGLLNFPPAYSVQNALQSAWFVMQGIKNRDGARALEVCTRASIANALLNTVIQGLNPAKNQIYYIVRGNELQAERSYFGTIAVVKRIPGIKEIYADVVYEGDKFIVSKSRGNWHIDEHTSSFENIDPEKIIAAYAAVEFDDGREPYIEIMNHKQILNSWNRSTSSKRTTHKEFPDQMAKRTVINRACKYFLFTSNDQDLVMEAFSVTGEQFENEAEAPKQDSRILEINEEISAEIPAAEEGEESA